MPVKLKHFIIFVNQKACDFFTALDCGMQRIEISNILINLAEYRGPFLANRTQYGRAYATVLPLSVCRL